MTVPIMPGPFSFLATLGKAGGEAFAQHQADVDKKRKQAQDTLNQMIELRQQGLLQPDQFGTPQAMALYHTLGILPVSDKPTVAEKVVDIQRRFLEPDTSKNVSIPSMGGQIAPIPSVKIPTGGPSSVTDTERMVAKLPTRSAVALERVAADSGVQAEAAKNAATISSYTESMASRAVDATIGKLGGDYLRAAGPNGANVPNMIADAWTTAQQDAQMRGYVADEKYTLPFIQAQFAAKAREAELARVRMLAASNAGADPTASLLRVAQMQGAAVDRAIGLLPKPTDQQKSYAALYQAKIDAAKGDPAELEKLSRDAGAQYLRASYDAVQTYNSTIAQLQAESAGLRVMMQGAVAGAVPGITGGTPVVGPPKLTPAKQTQIVQQLTAGTATEQDVWDLLQRGLISQADYNTIMGSYRNQQGVRQSVTAPPKGPGPTIPGAAHGSSTTGPSKPGDIARMTPAEYEAWRQRQKESNRPQTHSGGR